MAAMRALTREEIANTEKKLDMPLDAIIKLSKTSSTVKANKQSRVPNKNQKTFNNPVQGKAFKVNQYMASRPFVRQGALAQKRSNFQGNHFPVAKDFARKAAVAPLRNRPFNNNALPYSNKAREGSFMVQRRADNRSFAAKVMSSEVASQNQQQQHGDGGIKPRTQTLDAMFANLKEERTRTFMQQQNNGVPQFNAVQQNNGLRQNNLGQQRNRNFGRRGVPWARNRFAN
ncbi:hypothetical protein LINPERPRIM_LOCUS24465 [Linum perenne]